MSEQMRTARTTNIYNLLERPWLYKLTSCILGCGGAFVNRKVIKRLLATLPKAQMLLDVGCGPESKLILFGLNPIGLDLSRRYVEEYSKQGTPAVNASADRLPFANNSFDGIWTIGLFHHLPQEVAKNCLRELGRVCKPGGYIVLFDAALPRSPWTRPLAQLIRRLDRGKHMRFQEELEALLPDRKNWETKRYTYALTGLEMLLCTYHKKGRTN